MINEALRLVRVYHDLSLADAGKRVGLSKSYISEIEKGHKKVTMDVLEKYSLAFDVPMSSLLFFAERAGDQEFSDNARQFVAEKALKMLDWIATISADREMDRHG